MEMSMITKPTTNNKTPISKAIFRTIFIHARQHVPYNHTSSQLFCVAGDIEVIYTMEFNI
jgi:hypothetical protein